MIATRELLGFDVEPAIGLAFIGAVAQACRTPEPLRGFVLVVTPEVVRLARRLDVVIEYQRDRLYALARKVERFTAPAGALAVLAIGDDSPRLFALPLGSVKAWLQAPRADLGPSVAFVPPGGRP